MEMSRSSRWFFGLKRRSSMSGFFLSRVLSVPSTTKRRRKGDKEQVLDSFYWSMLPEDLQVEILRRLKFKQLSRLKCVSKSWHLFISQSWHLLLSKRSGRCPHIKSSSSFCGLIMTMLMFEEPGPYLESCYDFNSCLLGGLGIPVDNVEDWMKLFVGFLPQPEELQDCCNGVLLIAHFAKCPRQYYVFNSTTRQCIKVPVNKEHYVHTYKASLVFDPMDVNSPTSFMVVVPREYSKHFLKLDVFSSRLDNWSSCIVPLDSFVDGSKLIERCVYLKGSLYMLSADKYLVSISITGEQGKSSDSGRTLLAASQTIELPGKQEFDSCGSFGVSKGDLVYSNSDPLNIVIWVLENGAHWVLQHRISVREMLADCLVASPVRNYCKSGGLMKVCAFHPYSDEIFVVSGVNIQIYNTRTKGFIRTHVWLDADKPADDVFPVSHCAVILDHV